MPAYMHTCTCINACAWMYTRACMHVCVHKCVHECMHAMHTCIACMHFVYIGIHIHT